VGARLPSQAASRPPSTFFVFTLALYVCITVGRLHEVVPILGRLYIGKVSAVLLIIGLFANADRIPLRQALKTRTSKCVGVISVLAFLSIPGSFWPGQSVGFVTQVWPFAVLLAIGVLAGFGQTRTACVCIACLVVVGATAALELLFGGGLTTMTALSGANNAATQVRSYIGNESSTTYDPNFSAAFFVMILPYAIMFASRAGRMRWVAIPAVPVLAVAMLATGSRGGIIALIVLLGCTVTFAEKRQRKMHLAFLAIAIGAMVLTPHAELAARLKSLFMGEDYNFDARDGRWAVWVRGLGLMLRYPLFGVGIRAFIPANGVTAGSYVDAHSSYVEIAAELGIGGLVSFVLMIGTAFKSATWRAKVTRAVPSVTNQTRSSSEPAPQSLESALATAALCSLIAELTAAAFLSMAYHAMTIFALTAPVALALTMGSGARAAGAAARIRSRAVLPPRRSLPSGATRPGG
jgi:O-antigen ligase